MNFDFAHELVREDERHLVVPSFWESLENLKGMIDRKTIENKNFINRLGEEFDISKEDFGELQNKIDEYLKEFSDQVKTVTYVWYDAENRQFCEDFYSFGSKVTTPINPAIGVDQGVGVFHTYDRGDDDSLKDGSYLGKAIEISIREQLEEGRSIDEINLFEMKDDYKNTEPIACLYKN